jgi:hypothetical protein
MMFFFPYQFSCKIQELNKKYTKGKMQDRKSGGYTKKVLVVDDQRSLLK